MKGHMQDGKFHPHTQYKGVRKSRDQQVKNEGVKIRKERMSDEEWHQKQIESVIQRLEPKEVSALRSLVRGSIGISDREYYMDLHRLGLAKIKSSGDGSYTVSSTKYGKEVGEKLIDKYYDEHPDVKRPDRDKPKALSQKRLQNALEKFLEKPSIAGTADEFHGYKETGNGLWLSAEEGNLIDGEEAFNYYGYDGGVNPKMDKWLRDRGWYAEYHDAGTVMLYKI